MPSLCNVKFGQVGGTRLRSFAKHKAEEKMTSSASSFSICFPSWTSLIWRHHVPSFHCLLCQAMQWLMHLTLKGKKVSLHWAGWVSNLMSPSVLLFVVCFVLIVTANRIHAIYDVYFLEDVSDIFLYMMYMMCMMHRMYMMYMMQMMYILYMMYMTFFFGITCIWCFFAYDVHV